MYGGPPERFQRNGGVRLVTNMCCLLFISSMKRNLFGYNPHFALVILSLVLLFLDCAKRGEGGRG
jgi:hypothetical protein